jgi:hypothetical protein
MPLAKESLGYPVVVASGTTATVYSVTLSKPAYIKSLIIHNVSVGSTSSSAAQTFQVFMVPNDAGSVGVATAGHRISRGSIIADDTYFFELQYPLTLKNNGDSIQVFNEGRFAWTLSGISTAWNAINVLVLGDKES